MLYLIEILHQTTTVRDFFLAGFLLYLIEILHQTTTFSMIVISKPMLYLIEILHQTTTYCVFMVNRILLYLIEILHQTTTLLGLILTVFRCILSKFYIKPQQCRESPYRETVVSYRNSTSNHNSA